MLRSSFDGKVRAPLASTAPQIPSLQNGAWHSVDGCINICGISFTGGRKQKSRDVKQLALGHTASLWGTGTVAWVSCLLLMCSAGER